MEIPPLDMPAIENAIKLLETLNYSTATVEEIKTILNPIFTGFSTAGIKYQKGVYTKRMSKCDKPSNISRVKYPPKELAVRGRANDNGESIFYASIGKAVPLFELNPKEGDTLVISTWKTIEDMLLNQIGYTKDASVELNSLRDFESIFDFREKMHGYGEVNEYVYRFLAMQFIRKIEPELIDDYKLTVAISHKLMMGDAFHGIFYPTVKMFGNAENLALKPDFVDKGMKLVSLEFIKITGNTGINYSFETLDSAVSWDETGKIKWSGRLLGWNFTGAIERTFSSENGEWITKDNDDQRLDPVPTTLIDLDPSALLLKFKNAYPTTAKFGGDRLAKGDNNEVIIRYNLHYDFSAREKFMSFYIPSCHATFNVAIALGNAYNQFIESDKEAKQSIIISTIDKPEDSISSDDLRDIKFMHFFTEDYIDLQLLAQQVIAGYQIRIEHS